MEKNFFVYIMTNARNRVLYTGVTSDLTRRVSQHRIHRFKGFSARYNAEKLVFFEHHWSAEAAIRREKQIKAGSRKKKIELISKFNPEWRDLWELIN